MLRIRNLEAGYGELRVVKGVSLHVAEGEIVAVIGANGAGKTTLLNTIAGLVRPSGGVVQFKGTDIQRWTVERIVASGCALVPEGRKLFSPLSVRENLNLGAYVLRRGEGREAVAARLEELYQLFPRLKERERQFAGTLSGGEQQMLAIGRALMSKPKFIMFDEPSMGLAPLIIKDIFAVIKRLRSEGVTVLVVEQNAKAILKIADRGYVMETGSLILEGSGEELLANRDVQRAYLGKEYASMAEGRERP